MSSTPCDVCHAGCCRSFQLFVTALDVMRLAAATGNDVGSIATFHPIPLDLLRGYSSQYEPVHFSDPAHAGTPHLLALRREESTIYPGTKRCIFLAEEIRATPLPGGHPGATVSGRCSVHASRPEVCRVFPAVLHAETGVALLRVPPPESAHPAHQLCPEPWTPAHFGVDALRVPHQVLVTQYERDFYNRAVKEFGPGTRSLAEFFPFMQRVYAARLRAENLPAS